MQGKCTTEGAQAVRGFSCRMASHHGRASIALDYAISGHTGHRSTWHRFGPWLRAYEIRQEGR